MCTDIYLIVFKCSEPQKNCFNVSLPSCFFQVSFLSAYSKHTALLVPFTLLCILSRPCGGLLWQFSIAADMNELFVWSHNLFSKTSVAWFWFLFPGFGLFPSFLTFSSEGEVIFERSSIERTSTADNFVPETPDIATPHFTSNSTSQSQAKCPELQVQAWIQTFYKAL